jgi:hypothetical protein
MQSILSILFNLVMMMLSLLPFVVLGLAWIVTAKAWAVFKQKNPYVDFKD